MVTKLHQNKPQDFCNRGMTTVVHIALHCARFDKNYRKHIRTNTSHQLPSTVVEGRCFRRVLQSQEFSRRTESAMNPSVRKYSRFTRWLHFLTLQLLKKKKKNLVWLCVNLIWASVVVMWTNKSWFSFSKKYSPLGTSEMYFPSFCHSEPLYTGLAR